MAYSRLIEFGTRNLTTCLRKLSQPDRFINCKIWERDSA